MVLGHTFTFEDQESADQMVKYLRKEGISARIEPFPQTKISFAAKGKYTDLMAYLEAVKEEILTADQEEPSEDAQSEESSENSENPEEFCEEDDEYDPEDEIAEVDELVSTLEADRATIEETLNGKNAGDILLERTKIDPENPMESMMATMGFLYKNRTLLDNEMIRIEDDAFRLEEVKPVDDLVFTLEPPANLIPDDENLKTHNLTRIQHTKAEVEYKVRAGPEIIGRIDFKRLGEELESMGMNDEYEMHAIHSILLKQQLAEHIMKVLDESKAGTVDELISALKISYEELDDDSHHVNSYDISPSFTLQVIEDLKKLEFIRMKGNRIKFTR